MSNTVSLTITDNLSVVVSEESRKIVRTVENKAGSIRVSFVPVSAKTGVSLKSLGYKGSAAKAVIRKAKREIGSAIVGAMATAVSSGKLDWRSAVLSKTGTLGIFFSQGEGADAGELAKAEERAKEAEAKLAQLAKENQDAKSKWEAVRANLVAKGTSQEEMALLGL